MVRRRSGRRALALAIAIAAPAAARLHEGARVDRLAASLGELVGEPVALGAVDVELTGVVRLERISIPGHFEAEAIEAGVSAASLLSGHPRADEVIVRRPTLHLTLDERGEPTALALVRRIAARLPRRPADRAPRATPRRIVVEGGALEVRLPGGRITAHDVTLEPTDDAVRLVTGALAIDVARGPYRLVGGFGRGGLELERTGWRPTRVLLTGGELEVAAGIERLALRATSVQADDDGTIRVVARDPLGGALALAVRGSRFELEAEALPLGVLGAALPPVVALADARYSGHVVLALGDPVELELHGRLEAAALHHPLLDAAPVPLSGELDLVARSRTLGRRRTVEVERAALAMGPLRISGHGRAELAAGDPLPMRAELTIELAPLPCAALPEVLPPSVGAELRGLAATGELDGRATLSFDRAEPDATRLIVDVHPERCRIIADPPRVDVRRLLATVEVARPGGRTVQLGGDDGIELGRLHRHTVGAFVAAEDARFFDHDGFDLEQIQRSLAIDLGEGRLLRGGSTISQQLVKNVFVGAERTLTRKLAEALVTWRLEQELPKKVILARYLDVIELGDGIYGLSAAARHYFGKDPVDLDVAESAFLAALTPAPRTLARRLREAGRIDPDMARRTDVVLRAMRGAGVIDRDGYARAAARPPRLRASALARR